MKMLRAGLDLDRYFQEMAASQQSRLLLLDYDGTLAPFQKQRDQAFPYPGVVDALRGVQKHGKTRIVIVSGRALQDLLPMLSFNPLPELWGSHGWERRRADGSYALEPIGSEARRGLNAAYAAARGFGGASQCEIKPVSIALHWRGLSDAVVDSFAPATVEAWRELSLARGLELHSFDGGVELRVPGRDKGYAVRTLRTEMAADAFAAFLGDDLTDEDAFAALEGSGLGILVRPEYRPTRADIWLRPPEELLYFLTRWGSADAGG